MMRAIPLLLAAALLTGCQHTLSGSVAGGECKIFERPSYAVRGLRTYDQNWIDSQVEGGVGGCGWARPQPRPASIDAKPAATKQAAPTAAARKRSLLARIRAHLAKRPPVEPAPPGSEEPAATPESAPAPVVVVPAPPPDPIDQLLNPNGPKIER